MTDEEVARLTVALEDVFDDTPTGSPALDRVKEQMRGALAPIFVGEPGWELFTPTEDGYILPMKVDGYSGIEDRLPPLTARQWIALAISAPRRLGWSFAFYLYGRKVIRWLTARLR